MARAGRRSSNKFADEIDAITPCPLPTNASATCAAIDSHVSAGTIARHCRSSPPSSPGGSGTVTPVSGFESRRNSIKTLEEGTDGNPEQLWKRMLALQQLYGCYKSARMSAALELGDAGSLLPSKTCLDLMNEDLHALPGDVEAVLKESSRAREHKIGSKHH
ncbi:hypothetical protein PFICI_08463 [Pestalotiopsis fici W106-1]|uniref:Uncharacterized protein n=1 Tax=Pestalotiopsis fici (strain W106-1 / CGMCC3.15140) TaxID=1229662 RepID=W3X4J8_PESFW|nr:uncharacterized protein PFICI_08463 [Pestalotiopsis fici W106-1]ETS80934.1 hypothetical protein PFICI_08463 [Pestalotiopsis fici W106-1]